MVSFGNFDFAFRGEFGLVREISSFLDFPIFRGDPG